MEPFIGQIIMFGGNFAPRGWAFCDGQLLPISSNTALFSLLGTMYGGDGRTTFALPDLRGRVPIHQGDGPGLTDRNPGHKGGSETVTLTENELPSHEHIAKTNMLVSKGDTRSDRISEKADDGFVKGTLDDGKTRQSVPAKVFPTGEGQPVNNMQPYLCVSYVIALTGIFPSRN